MSWTHITIPNPNHVHTFELKGGGQAHVLVDDDPSSPREWDNLSRMVNVRGNYLEPDGKQADSDLLAVAHVARQHGMDEAGIKAMLEFDPRKVTDADIENAQEREDDDFLLLVDHGCNRKVLAVQEFDYGNHGEAAGVGVIFEDDWLREGMRTTLNDPAEVLAGEIKTYIDYVEGNVYGVVIEDADGNETESCWGFQGYDYDDPKIVTDHFGEVVES